MVLSKDILWGESEVKMYYTVYEKYSDPIVQGESWPEMLYSYKQIQS